MSVRRILAGIDFIYIFFLHSNWQTFAHFLKASIGTGVLAMPSAFANSGYVNGILLTVLVGILAVYCLHILVSHVLKEGYL